MSTDTLQNGMPQTEEDIEAIAWVKIEDMAPYLAKTYDTIKEVIAAFLISFAFTFPIGFFLSRYVVFENTDSRKREQLPKYMVVVLGAILMNYFFLKVFIETMSLSALTAKLLTTIIVVAFSFYSQKYFTFKEV
jgi:putative flippase GtrA